MNIGKIEKSKSSSKLKKIVPPGPEQRPMETVAYDEAFFDKGKIPANAPESESGKLSKKTRDNVLALVEDLNAGSPFSERAIEDKEVLIFDQKLEKGDYSRSMDVRGKQLVSGLFSNSESNEANLDAHTETAIARVSRYKDKLAISMIDSIQNKREDKITMARALHDRKNDIVNGEKAIADMNFPLSTLRATIDLKVMSLKCNVSTGNAENFQGTRLYIYDGKEISEYGNFEQDFALASGDVIFIASNNVLNKLKEQNINPRDASRDYQDMLLASEVKNLLNVCSTDRDAGGKVLNFDQNTLFNKLSELYIRSRMAADSSKEGKVVASYVAYQVP